jgi:hypothetical protein
MVGNTGLRNEGERQYAAYVWDLCDQRHHQQIREEQRQECERVLAEQPDALSEPYIAGLRGNFN